MFGYLQIEKSELRVREYEQYKAVYCTLCKRLGKNYSFLSRFILSYDMTLFSLLLLSLDNTCPGYYKGRCTCNPFKKCTYCKQGGEVFDKASALSVITAYYKILDDIEDSSFAKRCFCKAVKSVFSHWHKKASKKYPDYEQTVKKMWCAQNEVEKNIECHIDLAAEPTAVMMKELLILEATDDTNRLVLGELGYQLGRWVYLIDAADDVCSDIETSSFNPLKEYYNGSAEDFKEKVNPVLNQCLSNVYNSFNLLGLKHFDTIIDNIFFLGLRNQQIKVLEGKNIKKERK